jgi:hypothetical protein
MRWTEKYWDALEQLYWSPSYLGLKSIPKSQWDVTEERVSVPKSMVNMRGALYRRVGPSSEFPQKVRLLEETFNHLFDLTFGILDGEIINDLFCEVLGVAHEGSLRSHGRDLGAIFGQADLYEVSQSDGYFAGDQWSLAVELKFDAATSLDQLAKYVLAFCVERAATKTRKPLALLYISPKTENLLSNAFPFASTALGANMIDVMMAGAKPSVQKALQGREDEVGSVLDDWCIQLVSWEVFAAQMRAHACAFEDTSAAHRTVRGLILGLCEEIEGHPKARLGLAL